jgi:hypothetical protein
MVTLDCQPIQDIFFVIHGMVKAICSANQAVPVIEVPLDLSLLGQAGGPSAETVRMAFFPMKSHVTEISMQAPTSNVVMAGGAARERVFERLLERDERHDLCRSVSETSQEFQNFRELLRGVDGLEARVAVVEGDGLVVANEGEALALKFNGGDFPGGGAELDAREGEEMGDGIGETSEAVAPGCFEGIEVFFREAFGEFAVGVDAEFGVVDEGVREIGGEGGTGIDD